MAVFRGGRCLVCQVRVSGGEVNFFNPFFLFFLRWILINSGRGRCELVN